MENKKQRKFFNSINYQVLQEKKNTIFLADSISFPRRVLLIYSCK